MKGGRRVWEGEEREEGRIEGEGRKGRRERSAEGVKGENPTGQQ